MDRARVLELVAPSAPMLAGRYGVTRLALFGSPARDIDTLVAFAGPAITIR